MDIIIINIPRYIGFLEYLKIPDVTSLLVSSNLIGLIVVFDFMNCSTGFIKISIPTERIKIDIGSWNGMWIKSIFFDEKKIEIIKIKTISGGGIFIILLL